MKFIVNLIVIAVLAFIVYGVVQFKQTGSYNFFRSKVDESIDFVQKKTSNIKQNVAMELEGERKRPVTLINQETALMALSPNTFKDFGPSDWRKFWDVIYDPIREGGLFGAKRYRTKEEIKSYLLNNYSGDFSKFRREDWQVFWKIVFEK